MAVILPRKNTSMNSSFGLMMHQINSIDVMRQIKDGTIPTSMPHPMPPPMYCKIFHLPNVGWTRFRFNDTFQCANWWDSDNDPMPLDILWCNSMSSSTRTHANLYTVRKDWGPPYWIPKNVWMHLISSWWWWKTLATGPIAQNSHHWHQCTVNNFTPISNFLPWLGT